MVVHQNRKAAGWGTERSSRVPVDPDAQPGGHELLEDGQHGGRSATWVLACGGGGGGAPLAPSRAYSQPCEGMAKDKLKRENNIWSPDR
ncbi:hypothetical protein U9M48_033239 [Paspalum notatum var. saurae]|uniref:Uncharacterized protein n=1 Tax=Paspalum notatum var. saurae TaxID=547442 RepID=A0AAQ3U938_PASNO